MRKVFAAKLRREIEKRAKESPFRVDFESFKESKFNGHRVKASVVDFGYEKVFKQDSRQRRYYTLKRNQAIHAMLYDGVWSKQLAEMYEITKADVQYYYSQLIHMRIMINNEFGLEFREFIKQKAVECYTIEKQKKETYMQGIRGQLDKKEGQGLLRTLIAGENYKREHPVPPRLLIEEELFPRGDEMSALEKYHNSLDELYKKRNKFEERTTEDGQVYRVGKAEISD